MASKTPDSVPLYSEGTFEDHIQELVDYLARGRSDEERITYIKPFVEALLPKEGKPPFEEDAGRRRSVLNMVIERVSGVGDGNDKEVEGFFNLLVAYILDDCPHPEAGAPIEKLVQSIVSAKRAPSIKYRVLSNIFNACPRSSPLRPKVYSSLLKLASDNEEIDALHLHKTDVDKWLDEWDVNIEERAAFCKGIADALVKAGQPPKAYPYLILRAQILPATSPVAERAMLDAIVDGLRLTSVFNFEPILSLPNITLVQTHPLFALVKVFLSHGLPQYHAWLKEHAAILPSHALDEAPLERKIRLLTLASLASARVGKEITYEEIASNLQIQEKDVESWIINAIRAKLIVGKMNQPSKSFVVIRSNTREFARENWETLDKRLSAWKGAVLDVLQVVSAARRRTTNVGGTQNAPHQNAIAA